MRFVHSSDWHLGRLFHGVHLTEDQAHVLGQFVQVVKDASVDAVLIAGDVFDRSVPPPEAVQLLDETLCALALGARVPVILIAGNHDSPQRVGYASRLLRASGVHVFGVASRQIGAVTLHDSAGPVTFHALPYAEPPVIRHCFGQEQVEDHDQAMRLCVQAIRQAGETGEAGAGGGRSVVIGHAFVQGGEASESERPLSVGGAGTVDPSHFAGFSYAALGHLHRPQRLGGEGRVHYSGSLLKYSFAEAAHRKVVNIVEIDGQGRCRVEPVALSARRDVRCLKGTLADVLQGPQDGQSRDDYIHVTLEDRGALLDPMGKIREVYPNVLGIERAFLSAARAGEGDGRRLDHTKVGETELFGSFFEQVTGEPITAEQSSAFSSVVDALRQEEREVPA